MKKVIKAEYIESGTFVAGEEDCSGFEEGSEVIILSESYYKSMKHEITRLKKLEKDLNVTKN